MSAEWFEIRSTQEDSLRKWGEQWHVHPLALEDCLHQDQRPKLEDYGNHQFLVWFMLWEETFYELQFLIFSKTGAPTDPSAERVALVTHCEAPGGVPWQEFLKIREDHTPDAWHLVYQALDHATDITWKELRKIFFELDQMEARLFDDEIDPRHLLSIKNKLNEAEFLVGHLSSISEQIKNVCGMRGDLDWKLRDLHDHGQRMDRNIALYRAQVATTIDLYWGLQSNRTNRQIKKLTVLASLTLPMTFWCSFWGMNFESIPFADPLFFKGAMGLMLASLLVSLWILKNKGYWKDR